MDREDVNLQLEIAKEKMQTSLTHLEEALTKIRAGKADPAMLNGIKVDCYGTLSPISQVANMSAPDSHSIAIQPWDKSTIQAIETAIINSDLGLNPDNNGEVIRVNIPALTAERRKDLVKQAKTECETTKISIRNTRREMNDVFKKMVKEGLSEDMAKDAEDSMQKMTDEFGKKIDSMLAQKEKDITTL